MATILVGTSGYSYTEWVGPVYPAGTTQGDYLGLYSRMFSTVELNFSYYRMPNAEHIRNLLKQADGRLTFSIKANEALTHTVETAMEAAGHNKLQFPTRSITKPDQHTSPNALSRQMAPLPLSVEFRNGL